MLVIGWHLCYNKLLWKTRQQASKQASKHKLTLFGCLITAVILIGVAVITACAVNLKPAKAAAAPTATPTILGGAASTCYTGEAQKIVTDLPAGMRYAIRTEKIDPTTIDAGKIVPKGYTALDYIQSTGTQYIDSGVYASGDTRVVIDWQFNNITEIQQRIFGNKNSSFYFEMYLNTVHEISYCYNDDAGNWVSTRVAADTGRHIFDLNGFEKTIQIDNGQTFSSGLSYNTVKNISETTVNIFANGNFGDDRVAQANAYSCRIYEKGVLQRDFVPASKDNGDGTVTLGMYDVHNNQFYTNQGTKGDFVAGNAVNTTIKGWEWLDSVDAAENNRVLDADTTYYVYYYTPTTDTITATPLRVSSFNVHDHVYGDWQTTTPATCTTDGEREHVCQNCGHVDSEVVPATGHNYVRTFDQGMTTFTCSFCGNAYQKECDGEHSHEFIDSTIAPDCTEVGYTKHTCTRCHYSYEDNFIPALGHNYGSWTTTEPATTDHAGEQERICERCGAKQNRTLPALAGSTTNGGKDNSGPLLWGIIIGVIAVLAGCGGLAWLLIALFKPKHQKKTEVAAA